MNIEISEVNHVHLSPSKLTLSFDEIELKNEKGTAKFQNIDLSLGGSSNKRPFHEANIQRLEIYLKASNDSALSTENESIINLLEFLPIKIFQNYSGIDIWINELLIHDKFLLKEPFIINDLDLSNKLNSLNLGFSILYDNESAEVLLEVNNNNSVTLNIHLSEKDFININIQLRLDEISKKIVLVHSGNLQISDDFNSLIKKYFIYSDKINAIQGKISFSGEHNIDYQLSSAYDLYPMLASGTLNSTLNSFLAFYNLPIESVDLDLSVNIRNIDKTSTTNTIKFLNKNLSKLQLNTKYQM